jgi:PAS domain S-box-containing protein
MGPARQREHGRTTKLIDQLLAHAPDAMVIIGADGRIVRVNTRAEKLFGYPQEELLGQKPDLLLPWPRNVRHRAGQVARSKIRPFVLEALVRRRDGTKFRAEICLGLLKIGSETLISSAIQDIQRERSEELDLRALVEASDDAIIGKTIDGTIISWNKGAEKTYGYKAEEILGKPISVLMPPGHPNEFPKIMIRLRRGEHIKTFETTRIHKDGHIMDVSVTISPVRNTDGKIVGASVVARDITQQKRDQEALRISEERFRAALKSAPVVVFSQDLGLRYTWMNSINSPLLSLAPEDYMGRTDSEIFGSEEGARLTTIKEEVLRTGIDSHAEVTVTLKGQMHYFDLVVEPLRDPRGKLIGLLCSAIDITSLKETIANLQQALDDVQMLKGLLPICASCKKIRDDRGTWQIMEKYIQDHSEAKFSHGICPECMRKLYPEYYP